MEGEETPRLKPAMVSRKLLVLAFVRDYIASWQGSPSYGEIAAGVGVSQTRAKQLVKALVKEHRLLRRPGTRGLSLPARHREALQALREAGWNVSQDNKLAVAPDCPKTTLQPPPVLDYVAPHKGDARGIDRTVGTAASGTGRAGTGARRQQRGHARAVAAQGPRHGRDA